MFETGMTENNGSVSLQRVIDLRSIKKLIKNSYIYSGMDDSEKSVKHNQWNVKWNAFIRNWKKSLINNETEESQ